MDPPNSLRNWLLPQEYGVNSLAEVSRSGQNLSLRAEKEKTSGSGGWVQGSEDVLHPDSLLGHIYIYIYTLYVLYICYTYIYIYVYMCRYMNRKRERKTDETDRGTYIYIPIRICIHIRVIVNELMRSPFGMRLGHSRVSLKATHVYSFQTLCLTWLFDFDRSLFVRSSL